MSFVGIISTKKEYDFIKKEIGKISDKNINLIHINKKSIENLNNVKFDIIVIDKSIDNLDISVIQKILCNIKFLMINSDISMNFELLNEIETNIIDYGLKQKATVTASSISDENIIICLQRNIRNINEKIIEINETKINIENYSNKRIYNFLIIYILKILYN